MKNLLPAFVALICLTFSACHRPVAYFQRPTHSPATRLAATPTVSPAEAIARMPETVQEDLLKAEEPVGVASVENQFSGETDRQIRQHQYRISRLLNSETPNGIVTADQQPKPKPKPKMKLGNRIRDALGMPLRPELNWWQRISWKLKASVIIILVAVLFAILHVTILAIIFGVVGAFLLISGLRRSFKVRRPWF